MRGGAWALTALGLLSWTGGGASAQDAPVPSGTPTPATAREAGGPPPSADVFADWTQRATDGGRPFRAVPALGDLPREAAGSAIAACDLAPGVEASLERTVVLQDLALGAAPRPELELSAWVWLGPTAGGGEVGLELVAEGPSGATTLAASPRWSVDAVPKGRWLLLATQPPADRDPRVPADTRALCYRLSTSASGVVAFAGTRVRRAQRNVVDLFDASFEWGAFAGAEAESAHAAFDRDEVRSPRSGGWRTSGPVQAGSAAVGGYYGLGHARLEEGAVLDQRVALEAGAIGRPALVAGDRVEAGVWLRVEVDGGSRATSTPDGDVLLEVMASAPLSSVERPVARARWRPTRADVGGWVHVETEPLAPLAPGETRLRWSLTSSVRGALSVDHAQLGQQHAIDGNPARRVGANYVGRFRSPLFPGATTQPATAKGRWRNWHWELPPACDGSFAGFFHSPDCATSATCLRASGRRDGAVTVESGADAPLPLAGAYDSRDPDVVRYHLQLAAAAGIDHFVYDWQGILLAEQDLQQGREPLNAEAFETLLAAASEPGCDVKVATMYEPKVHLLGWVQGQPTLAQKVAGITADLGWLAQHLRGSRAALRSDGRLVVFLFRNLGCDPSGTQCLDEAAWASVHAAVLAQTGEDLLLVADAPPAAGSALDGFTRWRLIARELLRYRSWSDARDGVPSLPAPALPALEAHVDGLAAEVASWAAVGGGSRLGVLTVWPHFDDTGVGGWGVPNLPGDDGASLCVRVLDDFAGATYAATVEPAFVHGFDWIQIATWNDWNEETRIEPAWHGEFLQPVPSGSAPSAAVHEHVLGRLEATRQWIAAFKGRPSGGPSLRSVAVRYLSRARRLAHVVEYD